MFVPRTARADIIDKILGFRDAILGDFRYLKLRRFVDESLANEWVSKELSTISGEYEASFIWEDKIEFSFWNNDYAGQDLDELKRNALKFLRTTFDQRL